MLDPFVLLAPVVLLVVIALLRFTGCYTPPQITNTVTVTPKDVCLGASDTQQFTATLRVAGVDWSLEAPAGQPPPVGTIGPGGSHDSIASLMATYSAPSPIDRAQTVIVRATPAYFASNSDTATVHLYPFPPCRPTGSLLDANNPLATNLIGLYMMNGGSGLTDENLVDLKAANFSGAALPTWNTDDPSVVFNGGGSLNSYLDADETGGASAFDQLPISQITVVAKVFVNAPLVAAGVCEKNDGNTGPADSGFVFGWDNTGALRLTVEKSTTNMRVATAGSIVVPGNWIQVAFTWDGTPGHGTAADAHLFMNGAEQPKASAADGSGTLGYANATNQPFRIGNASYDPMAGCLNGKMAYLAIYKGRILMPTEINQLDTQLPITY